MRALAEYAPIPLRAITGFGFIYHGLPKVASQQGHAEFQGMLQAMAIPAPETMAWIVGIVEVAGGVALLLGLFTGIASTLLIIDMLVAMVKVHLAAGFSFMNVVAQTPSGPVFGIPGYEVNLLYIAALAAILMAGPGTWSLDAIRRTARVEETQTVIRAEPERIPIDTRHQTQ